MNVKLKSPPGRGPFVFKVHGAICYETGPAAPTTTTAPTYGQLFFLSMSRLREMQGYLIQLIPNVMLLYSVVWAHLCVPITNTPRNSRHSRRSMRKRREHHVS